jgi:hypothetical protein
MTDIYKQVKDYLEDNIGDIAYLCTDPITDEFNTTLAEEDVVNTLGIDDADRHVVDDIVFEFADREGLLT